MAVKANFNLRFATGFIFPPNAETTDSRPEARVGSQSNGQISRTSLELTARGGCSVRRFVGHSSHDPSLYVINKAGIVRPSANKAMNKDSHVATTKSHTGRDDPRRQSI